MIHKEQSFTSINDNSTDSISKMMSRSEMVPFCHQLRRKQQKKVDDYYQKSIDNFKQIIVNPLPKLTDEEKLSIATSFVSSSQ